MFSHNLDEIVVFAALNIHRYHRSRSVLITITNQSIDQCVVALSVFAPMDIQNPQIPPHKNDLVYDHSN